MLKDIKIKEQYTLSFKDKYLGVFSQTKKVVIVPDFSRVYPSNQSDNQDRSNKLDIFNISIDSYLGYRDIFFSNEYINNFTIWINEVAYQGDLFLVLNILDIRIKEKYRGRGIGGQLMKIAEEIAKENNVKYIIGNLQADREGEPLSGRIKFFRKHGFEVTEKPGSGFSGFLMKKES